MKPLVLGSQYFAAVFAFAFVMGVLRTFAVAPLVGAAAATLVEVPIVLLVSWLVAWRLLRHHHLPAAQRGAVGVWAFVLTMASEAALAALLFDQNIARWAAAQVTPHGLIGLTGQLAFAAIPLLIRNGQITPSTPA